jgi:SsrA-binding protein
MAEANKKTVNGKVIAQNRKARFTYEILETFEAGIVLKGTEAKSLREGKISIEEAWAKVYANEVFLVGAHVLEYTFGNRMNHEPTRERKLLLKKREILKIKKALEQKGLTLVPLEVSFSTRGWAKIKLAIGKGRKLHDKRAALKKKGDRREMREYRR